MRPLTSSTIRVAILFAVGAGTLIGGMARAEEPERTDEMVQLDGTNSADAAGVSDPFKEVWRSHLQNAARAVVNAVYKASDYFCGKGSGGFCWFSARMCKENLVPGATWERIADYLERSCGLEYATGCDELAYMLLIDGVDSHRSLDFRNALLGGCSGGKPDSCAFLASIWRKSGAAGQGYDGVAEILMRACRDKDGAACKAVPELVSAKPGKPADVLATAALYEHACRLGVGKGCYQAALELATNTDVVQNPDRVDALLRKGCGQNYMDACHAISMLGSVDAFIKSCEGGSVDSCEKIDDILLAGWRGYTGYEKARQVCKKACELGAVDRCVKYAWLLKEGQGGPVDAAGARSLVAKLCSNGNFDSCGPAAHMALHGQGGPTDAVYAINAWSNSCDAGSPSACTNLGWMVLGIDDEMARGLFQAACYSRAGCAGKASCLNLAYLRLYRDGDVAGALDAFERGCKSGSPAACIFAAQMKLAGAPSRAAVEFGYREAAAVEDCKEVGETCLALSNWYYATGDDDLGAEYQAKGLELVAADCDAGFNGSCLIADTFLSDVFPTWGAL